MQLTAYGLEAAPAAAETLATPPAVESVMHAMMRFGRVMRQRVPGDTLEQGTFWLLKSLASQGAMRITDLAGCSNLDTSTVSRHVTQLERVGLVQRAPDPDDRRAQLVEISTAGRDHLEAGFGRRRELLIRSLADWNPADLTQLEHLLARFVGDLETMNSDSEQA